ncbi:MAG: Uma2 family endonuclease [Gemmataceae bacterium]|nr:Uma2 family endonuclease [Gemmataceae bacterium]
MAVLEQRVMPLVAGDHLTREEFLRRWEAMPEVKKAELIGGVVYMPSPTSLEHGDVDNDVGTWLGVYAAGTPFCKANSNSSAYLLDDCPQPDRHLRLLREYGGKSKVKGKYLHGAAELFAEVSLSSSAYDLHEKLELYQAAGVQEYLAVLLAEEEIQWRRLVGGRYRQLRPGRDGIWRSQVFPGLWLNGAALLAGKMAAVLEVLSAGMQSEEYNAFCERLRSMTPKSK